MSIALGVVVVLWAVAAEATLRGSARHVVAVAAWAVGGALAAGIVGPPGPVAVGLSGATVAGAAACWLASGNRPGPQRRRLHLVALSSAAAVAVAALVVSVELLFDLGGVYDDAAVGALAIVPLTATATRSSAVMARVDRIIGLSVRAGLAAVVVATTFVVFVVGFGGRPRGDERLVLLSALSASLLLASVAAPLWRRVDALANQLAYGRARAPSALLDEFDRRLTRPLGRDEQLLQLAESLREHLAVARVDLWTDDEGSLRRTVSLPHRPPADLDVDPAARPVLASAGVAADAWIAMWVPGLSGSAGNSTRLVPATHAGELLGLVVVEREARAEPFTTSDEQLLAELGPRLGLALQTMKLDVALRASLEEVQRHADDLQESRARIVEAADTERRRIERDLHDGAQQRLIALGLKAAMASKAIREDPEGAVALVEEIKAEVKASAIELRALSHGIYPPTLQGEGLAAAVPESVARFPFRVDVQVDGVGRYPASLEAAVFFCCMEALQNAAKHAGDDPHVAITLQACDDALAFEVSDDGAGFDTAAPGSGLVGMRDRAGAVGGSITVESETGAGTKVRGRFPLARLEAHDEA